MKNNTLLLILLLAHAAFARAQSMANYTFSTVTNGSLADMSAGTTDLFTPGNYYDDAASSVVPIGFDFWLNGGYYNQFSVNSNGQMRLGGTAISGTAIFNPSFNAPLLVPVSGNHAIRPTGRVHYKVTGAEPYRQLVMEWKELRISPYEFPEAGIYCTVQVRLYETTGIIEFAYGQMYNMDFLSFGMKVFVSSGSSSGTVGSVENITTSPSYNATATLPAANSFPASSDMTNLGSSADGSRRIFSFIPPVTVAPTNLVAGSVTATSMNLSWTDNTANEQGFAIFGSTDNIHFTYYSQTARNVTGATLSSLSPSTVYYWKVYAVSEGYRSAGASVSETTAPPEHILSAKSGNWNVSATWTGGKVPTQGDIVTIADGHTVTINANGLGCHRLIVGQNGVTPASLVYGGTISAALSVNDSIIIAANGDFNAGTGTSDLLSLTVGGGAPVSAYPGTICNHGIFDMNTTAKVSCNFTGSLDASIYGTGTTTDFYSITVNKGLSMTGATLEVLLPVTLDSPARSGNRLMLTAGTLKLSAPGDLVPYFGTNTVCGETARLWLNHPAMHIRCAGSGTGTGGGDPSVRGELRIDEGSFMYGSGDNTLRMLGGSSLYINGGGLTLYGAVFFSSGSRFTMTGGKLDMDPQAGNAARQDVFAVLSGSDIDLSGGTITFVDPVLNNNFDLRLYPGSPIDLSGTTMRFGDGVSTSAGNAGSKGFRIYAADNARLGNIEINNPSGPDREVTLANNLYERATAGNLNIVAGTFNLGGNYLGIEGATLTNNGSLDGAAAGSTISFSGSGSQQYEGAGAASLENLIIDNADGVVLDNLTNGITASNVYLKRGVLTNSDKLTVDAAIEIGSPGLLTAGGSFDRAPLFGSGTCAVRYMHEGANRATGYEIPPGRALTQLYVANEHGVTLTGGDIAVGTAVLDTGTFSVGSNTMTIGSVSCNEGNIAGNGSSNLIVDGAGGALKISDTLYRFKDLTVDGAQLFISSSMDIVSGLQPGTITLLNGAQLNTSGNVTLKSDSLGTAKLGYCDGSIDILSIERYLSPGIGSRLLTAPVNSFESIYNNWQENGNAPPGFGTHIFGPPGAANGLDIGNDYSLYTYTVSSGGWQSVKSTDQYSDLFKAGTGYKIYTGGDRTRAINPGNPPAANETVLRSRGTPLTGTVTFAGGAAIPSHASLPPLNDTVDAFTLIGNPYPSSIDILKVFGNTGTRHINTGYYWSFDPQHEGPMRPGRYVVYDCSLGISDVGAPPYIGHEIESGTAFFVQTTAPDPSLAFNDSNKQIQVRQPVAASRMTIKLYLDDTLADGCFVKFGSGFSPNVNHEDALKMENSGENISLRRNGADLAIEAYPVINTGDTIPLNVWRLLDARQYKISCKAEHMDSMLNGYLQDLYTGINHPLSMNSINDVPFQVDLSDTASFGPGRFRIIFSTSGLTCDSPVHLEAANIAANHAELSWRKVNAAVQYEYVLDQTAADPAVAGTITADTMFSATTLDSGTAYYLHVRTDCGNGKYSSWSTLSFVTPAAEMTDNLDNGQLLIPPYPNPFNDRLFIRTGYAGNKERIEITDVMGRTIKTGLCDGEVTEINTSGLKPGIYIIKYINENSVFSFRLLKE